MAKASCRKSRFRYRQTLKKKKKKKKEDTEEIGRGKEVGASSDECTPGAASRCVAVSVVEHRDACVTVTTRSASGTTRQLSYVAVRHAALIVSVGK